LLVWRIKVDVNIIPRRKDTSNDVRETIVAAHKSGNGYKAFPKQFGVQHSTLFTMENIKAKLFRSGCPSNFSPRSDRAKLQVKSPRVTC